MESDRKRVENRDDKVGGNDEWGNERKRRNKKAARERHVADARCGYVTLPPAYWWQRKVQSNSSEWCGGGWQQQHQRGRSSRRIQQNHIKGQKLFLPACNSQNSTGFWWLVFFRRLLKPAVLRMMMMRWRERFCCVCLIKINYWFISPKQNLLPGRFWHWCKRLTGWHTSGWLWWPPSGHVPLCLHGVPAVCMSELVCAKWAI